MHMDGGVVHWHGSNHSRIVLSCSLEMLVACVNEGVEFGVLVGLKCVSYVMYLCRGLLCVGLCMWIANLAMFLACCLGKLYNLDWDMLWAKKGLFCGCPCMGLYLSLRFCVVCAPEMSSAFHK